MPGRFQASPACVKQQQSDDRRYDNHYKAEQPGLPMNAGIWRLRPIG
jgi:hypothetical protein